MALLYTENILSKLENKEEFNPRKRIYILDCDTDEYKTINRIRVDSEGDIIIDVSQ